MKADLQALREKCPLPVLMRNVGLGQFAKSSCPSPFRNDENASWGIYERNGRWMFKDFATGECGDEIDLLAHLYEVDPKGDFLKLLDRYEEISMRTAAAPVFTQQQQKCENQIPDLSFLSDGTEEEVKRLSELRGISIDGLKFASGRGVLQFGFWLDYEVFAVVDKSGYLAEMRRLDGQVFSACGSLAERKSHTLRHSKKNWPLGILEAETCQAIALVEGMPDFLAMHQFILEENMAGKVAPVAMLTSSCDIAAEALKHFAGKKVRIFPHLDEPGIKAAERWSNQLRPHSTSVDFFNFRACEIAAGSVKDLCDFNQQRELAGLQQKRILDSLANESNNK